MADQSSIGPIQPLSPEQRAGLFIAMGAIGGLFLGYQGFKHLFVQGVTTEERRNMLIFSASMLLWWGANKLWDVEKKLDEYETYAMQQVQSAVQGGSR